MSISAKNRRRRLLIDRRYQLYYPVTWIGMVALALLNFVLLNLLISSPEARSESLLAVMRTVSKANAAAILLASGWMGFASILHSHRIAGAMYNISRTIQRVLEGDMDAEVRLRKEDFSTDVAGQINDLIALARGDRAETGEEPPEDEVDDPDGEAAPPTASSDEDATG